MARLSAAERAKLPDRAFAYIDSRGVRKLPIHDEPHVRNALARFDQVQYETAASREEARDRLLRAAKRHGIMPIGFISNLLRSDATDEPGQPSGARDLPDGFVTCLLTDIEGSTGHLQAMTKDYEMALERVRQTIRRSVLEEGGILVEVRADETFSVFGDAAAAVRAAVSLQTRIAEDHYPDNRKVRVRAGIHTGTVTLTSNGYIGLAIHKADRVASAAHGGQIVVSTETKSAVGDGIPHNVRYRSLGQHHLAGLPNTHRLYQIEANGLETDFPDLRTRSDPT